MTSHEEYEQLFPQPGLDSAFTRGRFQNKVAIVTGGASGIGRATVERFSEDGAAVAIFDLNEELGRGLERKLVSSGRKAKFYKVDVSDKEQCEQAVASVADNNEGMVHFLVNSAIYMGGQDKFLMDVTSDIWRKSMDVNVIGPSNMVQACFPFMKKDGKSCAVVNISSIRGHCAALHQGVYSTTKGALKILTKCMALDLSSVGIRVNSVSPGAVWTPPQITINSCTGRGDAFEQTIKQVHMTPQCFIEGAGVASAITFLCSADAMFIDGADLPVDCGFSAMGPEGVGQP